MKKFNEFISESAPSPYSGKDDIDVHNSLLKKKFKSARLGYTSDGHSHDIVHKILSKHGYKPVTNYINDGKPMPKPYSVYEKDAPYSRHVAQMQIKNGKVTHIRVDHHKDT